MSVLHLDFESRSLINIEECGLDRYLREPSTEPVMLAWAIGEASPQLWQRHVDGEFCPELKDALSDPDVIVSAWNTAFERLMLRFKFGIDIPLTRWDDPMILARAMSLPGYLEEASKILRLAPDETKLPWGTKKDPGEAQRLITKFCQPAIKGGRETLFGIEPPWFRDWDSDPQDWEMFGAYCCLDLTSERAIGRKLSAFSLPDRERLAWSIDQEINERGVYCDLDLARGSSKIAEQVKAELHQHIKTLTQVTNPNSRPQILSWLKTQGYSFSGLAKGFVARALDGECELTPEGRQVLELRRQSAKTSDAKLETILASVSEDGRLRHQYAFMGASRTGRWSGKGDFGGAQLQNLPRPSKAVAKKLDVAISLLRQADYLSLSLEFSSPMEAVTTAIRSVFRASPGKRLVVCDLNAVENRVLGWLTGCDAITEVFRQGKCPYLSFAVDMYGIEYEELERRYNAGDEEVKEMRQNSKAPILGCGYRLSGGEELITKKGDKIYTGLMGYARSLGIEMPQDLAHRSVEMFRSKYTEVKYFWYNTEEAAMKAIRTGKAVSVGPLTFQPRGPNLLQMTLPSGRSLSYLRPKIELDEKYNREVISYEGKIQGTSNWGRIKTQGGKFTEQSDQAISRDLLVEGMIQAKKRGIPVVLHSHDELVAECDKESGFVLDDLRECMIHTPDWAPGLILGADGFESDYYKK